MAKRYFYIDSEGEERGPLDGASVKLLIEAGQVRAHTPLRDHETENFTEAYRLTGGFSEEERRREPFRPEAGGVLPTWSVNKLASWWSVLAVGCLLAIGVLSIPAADEDESPLVQQTGEPTVKEADSDKPPAQQGKPAEPAQTDSMVAEASASPSDDAESIGSAWKDPYGEKSEREQEHELWSGIRGLEAIIENEREEFEREGGFN